MPDSDPIIPIKTLPLFGRQVPFYALTFDKAGRCTSPLTRDALIEQVRIGEFSDIVMYCHGWNTDWDHAMERYEAFFRGVGDTAATHPGRLPPGFDPILVGIAWPSAALVWPSEATPDLLGAAGDADLVTTLAEDMSDPRAAAFRALVAEGEVLDSDGVRRLADLLAPQFADARADDTADENATDAAALAEMFRDAGPVTAVPVEPGSGATDPGAGSPVGSIDAPATGDVQAAGMADLFGLRNVLRLATVLQMKDRAGVVGRNGIADTLALLLAETRAKLHLIGHSYGCKVLMSAICAVPEGGRRATSALLLQPAVNFLAFAPDVLGRPGGFRTAMNRIERPILITHSRRDFPLRQVFHLAVRRRRDLGEIEVLAGFSQWSALGGYGPANMAEGEKVTVEMPAAGAGYPAAGTHRIVSLAADDQIRGHSDVTNPFTFWAAVQNMAQGT